MPTPMHQRRPEEVGSGQSGSSQSGRSARPSHMSVNTPKPEAPTEPAPPSGYQEDGSYKLNTDITDKQAEEMGAQVTREQFERYMTDFAPVEKKLAGSLGEADPQAAGQQATQDAGRARASLDRMRSRYGASLTGGQRQAEDHQAAGATGLSALGAMNTTRQHGEDRDFNLRGGLINIGNNVNASAVGGLTQSAANASARGDAHNSAMANYSAQRSQQKAQTVSTVASLGAMAFMGI